MKAQTSTDTGGGVVDVRVVESEQSLGKGGDGGREECVG